MITDNWFPPKRSADWKWFLVKLYGAIPIVLLLCAKPGNVNVDLYTLAWRSLTCFPTPTTRPLGITTSSTPGPPYSYFIKTPLLNTDDISASLNVGSNNQSSAGDMCPDLTK